MANLIILPLLIPLLTGLTALIKRRVIRRHALIGGMTLNLVISLLLLREVGMSGILVSQMGDHPAPYGISIVIDSLSAIMLTITGIIAFALALYSEATIDANRERFAYYPLFAFLIMGINFAFLTGDLFTLYVAFEVMLMASFVLMTLGGERGQIEGGIKYVTLNLISSTIFLIAAGLTYKVAGTLNMAHLVERLAWWPAPGITTLLAVLFFIGFGIKSAIFPLFFWLPASYHTPPIAVTALFGGLLTKVGIYSMWRVLGMIFPNDVAYLQPLILGIAILTMIIGVLGAVAQTEMRRLLSFHIISQIGYLMIGLAIFSPRAMTGAIFFMIHIILSKTALFLVAGIAREVGGSYELKKLGGLYKTYPLIALLFLLPALSLAGIPPFSGFWAKFALIQAGLEGQQYLLTGVSLAVSVLTMFSMTKIWHEAFWKQATYVETSAAKGHVPATGKEIHVMQLTAGFLVALIVVIGVLAEPIYQLSQKAAEGILHPQPYMRTVLPDTSERNETVR